MNQAHEVHESQAGTAATPRTAGTGSTSRAVKTGGTKTTTARAQAVAGPFTVRDLVVGGSVLVMLIGSLIPYFTGVFDSRNMWNTLPLFFLGVGILLPLGVVGLLAGRRLSPTSRIRMGSLSLDQFASVVAVLAVAFFFLQTASSFTASYLVGLIGSLGLVAATTFARFIPPFAADFAGRKEVPAHITARDAVAPAPKPAAPKPAAPATPAAATEEHYGASSRSHGVAGAAAAGAAGVGAAARGSAASAEGGAPAETAGVGEGPAQDVGAGAVENGRGYTEASDVQVDDKHDDGASAAAASTSVGAASPDEPNTAGHDTAVSAPAGARAADAQTADPRAAGGSSPATAVHPVVENEPISATRDQEEEAPAIEAFWFAVGSSRPVIDESTGKQIFTFEPGDWELCLEDRGHEFVVQNKHTGQTGIMKDLTDIQIPPAEDSGSSRS